jgi:hypothetical protein
MEEKNKIVTKLVDVYNFLKETLLKIGLKDQKKN